MKFLQSIFGRNAETKIASAKRSRAERRFIGLLQEILKGQKRIMATDKDITDQLTEVNQTLTTIGTNVEKVAKESAAQAEKIRALESAVPGNASQALLDAVAAVKASALKIQKGIGDIDESIPDPIEQT